MAKGYRPAWVGQQRYAWFYLYGAVEPLTGRSLFWLLPDWKKESVQFFLAELEVDGELALVWDRAGSHRALAEKMPTGITPVFREYWERQEVLISMTAYPWWREALQK